MQPLEREQSLEPSSHMLLPMATVPYLHTHIIVYMQSYFGCCLATKVFIGSSVLILQSVLR